MFVLRTVISSGARNQTSDPSVHTQESIHLLMYSLAIEFLWAIQVFGTSSLISIFVVKELKSPI